MDRVIITGKEIKGTCPVYKIGDRIVLNEGYRSNLREIDNLCGHSLNLIMPYYVALSRGIDPRILGLSNDGKKAFVQCLDARDYSRWGNRDS